MLKLILLVYFNKQIIYSNCLFICQNSCLNGTSISSYSQKNSVIPTKQTILLIIQRTLYYLFLLFQITVIRSLEQRDFFKSYTLQQFFLASLPGFCTPRGCIFKALPSAQHRAARLGMGLHILRY